MKKLKIIVAVIVFITVATSCKRGNSIVVKNDSDYLSINYLGEVRFSDDEKSIQSISLDGYLKFTKNDKELLAESNAHGEVRYELYVEGKKLSADNNNAKLFIAEAIKEMIANGFDAKGRLSRLYNNGGSEAVLNEVSVLKNDNVKSMYLDYLLSTNTLSDDELLETAEEISLLAADFEKANLLKKHSALYWPNTGTCKAWIDAVNAIGSDFDKANALKSIIPQPMNNEQFTQVLNAITFIHADLEKANLLKQLIDKQTLDLERFDEILEAVDKISSNTDKANLLKQLVKTGIPDAESFDKLLDIVGHLGGDMDKATMLSYLTSKDIRSEQQWIALINATATISSNMDKSNLLVGISRRMPQSDGVKASFMNMAKTINSDMDYRRAVKGMEN